jgi:hypothetical protein
MRGRSNVLRIAAAVVVAAHGLIHLIGFVVPWGIAVVEGFPYRTTALGGALALGEAGARIVGGKSGERSLEEVPTARLALGLVEPADLVGQRETRGASVLRIRNQAEVPAGLEPQGDLLDVLAGAAVGGGCLRQRG